MAALKLSRSFTSLKKVLESGRTLIGFDLNEIGVGDNNSDANVGARILFRLCNLMIKSSRQ